MRRNAEADIAYAVLNIALPVEGAHRVAEYHIVAAGVGVEHQGLKFSILAVRCLKVFQQHLPMRQLLAVYNETEHIALGRTALPYQGATKQPPAALFVVGGYLETLRKGEYHFQNARIFRGTDVAVKPGNHSVTPGSIKAGNGSSVLAGCKGHLCLIPIAGRLFHPDDCFRDGIQPFRRHFADAKEVLPHLIRL